MGLFQRAGLTCVLTIGLDAEQFDFHALRRNRRRVDHDERSVGTAGGIVECARGQFLACTRRPHDQNSAVRLGRAVDGLPQLVHAGRAARHDAGSRRQLLEFLDFALQARGFQRACGNQDQPIGLEGLFDKVISATFDGRDGGFDVAVAGNHHDREIGVVALDLFEQLQTIELAALQPDVEEHQVGPAVGDFGERRIAVTRRPRRESLVVENPGDKIANVGFVIDNQNITCHRVCPYSQLPVAASILV